MEFVHKITGDESPIPWSKEESAAFGFARYNDIGGCKICKNYPVGRYVIGDACVMCAMKAVDEAWPLYRMGHPDAPKPFPINPQDAFEKGVDYFYRQQLCQGGPHFVQPQIKTGRCVACAAAKKAKPQVSDDAIISREDAAAMDLATYRTGYPCQRGHTARRYVSNGGCIECMRPLANRSATMTPIPSKLIGIPEQLQLFIGWSYDGRKFRSSDGKRLTKLQFNIMVGGHGHYEVSGGRPIVLRSSEAFIQNFVDKGNLIT